MLFSNRIILRAIEEMDLSTIATWRSKPEVYEYFYEYLPISSCEQRIWYERQLKDTTEINLIVAKVNGDAIGTVSIYHIDRRSRKAEWGRLLIGNSEWRSGGIGGEIEALILEYCFEHLNLHKLYCEVLTENESVISLHKKFGFKEDGVLRDHAFKKGRYVDVMTLSMLDLEYFNERKSGTLEKILNRMRRKEDAV